MFGFGEMNYESSRAFADDEDEDVSENQFGLTIEWTDEGQKYIEGAAERLHVFCAFVGKVALGFCTGFINKQEDFTLLGQIFLTGNEGTIDLCSQRPKRKPSVRIYLGGKSKPVVFALIDFYGIPRFLSNELVEKVSRLMDTASEVIVFHSENSAYNRSDKGSDGKLYYLTSSKFVEGAPQILHSKVEILNTPNLISGPSAAILTRCEMIGKPGLMLITYTETELVDSISLKPFFQVISSRDSPNSPKSGFALAKLFSQFQHNISQFVDVSNLYA